MAHKLQTLGDLYRLQAARRARRERIARLLYIIASVLLALECVFIIAH